MKQKIFIPYELAVIAKEKGFNEPCFGAYQERFANWSLHIMPFDNIDPWKDLIYAPLYQQMVDWFREKHKIVIELQLDQTSNIKFCIAITKWNGFADFEKIEIPLDVWGLYRDYNEGLNCAIEEAFKLI